MKFIMLINLKMPTVVGSLTYISKINILSECLEQQKNVIFSVKYFLCAVEITYSAELSMKTFYKYRAKPLWMFVPFSGLQA